MKKLSCLLFILLTLLLSGCSNDYKKYLAENTDTVIITIYGLTGELAKKEVIKTIKQTAAVLKVINFISDKKAPAYKCGYSGSIDFFKNGKSLLTEKMEFNLLTQCSYIAFLVDGKLKLKKLTIAGIKYLRNLATKKE